MINMRVVNNPVETSPWFHMRALHPHSFDVIRHFAGDAVGSSVSMGEGRPYILMHRCFGIQNGMIGHLVGSYDAEVMVGAM